MGSGCGTFELRLKAIKVGVSSIQLERSSCGEAMRCTQDESRFQVKVLVKK
jgi:hypothetical protein